MNTADNKPLVEPQPIDDGGPAFPTENQWQIGPNSYHYEGMSLRDYFAGEANEQDIHYHIMDKAEPIPGTDEGDGLGPDLKYPTREQARYMFADAMIAARKNETP